MTDKPYAAIIYYTHSIWNSLDHYTHSIWNSLDHKALQPKLVSKHSGNYRQADKEL